MDIYLINGILKVKDPDTEKLLLFYDLAELPASVDGYQLIRTFSAPLGLTGYLYLLPSGQLQLVVGLYIFTWSP